MANPQKRKGGSYENKIRKALESEGFPAVRNTQYDQRHKGAADVYVRGERAGPLAGNGRRARPALHIECKCQKSLPGARVLSALDQAISCRDESDCGGIALSIMHVHGTARDVVCMDLPDFLRLLRAWTR